MDDIITLSGEPYELEDVRFRSDPDAYVNPVEVWKDVAGWEGLYQVSSLGRVKSLARLNSLGRYVRERILKPGRGNAYGHLQVALYRNGLETGRKVHQLVAQAFLGPCPAGRVTTHRDSVPTNNRADNLRYVTNQQKSLTPHARRAVRDALLGFKNSVVKQYRMDGTFVAEYASIMDAARATGVYKENICMAIKGKLKSAGKFVWKRVVK